MKISIITASYNRGKTIRHTVESVLRQTYPDFEYIVVDGGSTDNSIDIVKEYQVAFKGRLKWISEKDKGIYDATSLCDSILTATRAGTMTARISETCGAAASLRRTAQNSFATSTTSGSEKTVLTAYWKRLSSIFSAS